MSDADQQQPTAVPIAKVEHVKIPMDQLHFDVGEVVRVKGWLFRIAKANRYRMILEPLPEAEVAGLVRAAKAANDQLIAAAAIADLTKPS